MKIIYFHKVSEEFLKKKEVILKFRKMNTYRKY